MDGLSERLHLGDSVMDASTTAWGPARATPTRGISLARQDAADVIGQTTLATPIACEGIGLHGGASARMVLHPAEAGHGIVFVRTDLGGATVPARYDAVVDTRLCTMLGRGKARIGTVEHVLAALAGAGIDNARIELNGPEVPILDGSAEPFLFLIDCAGVRRLAAPRRAVRVLRKVRVARGEAFAELLPVASVGLTLEFEIDFPAAAIGRQSLALELTPASFRAELARARTFTLAEEVAQLRAAGLARGGDLSNALVVQEGAVLNPGGLRMEREFVRHKLLDAVGDLSLAGGPLQAVYRSSRGGHALNNELLRALFAERGNWQGVMLAGQMALSAA